MHAYVISCMSLDSVVTSVHQTCVDVNVCVKLKVAFLVFHLSRFYWCQHSNQLPNGKCIQIFGLYTSSHTHTYTTTTTITESRKQSNCLYCKHSVELIEFNVGKTYDVKKKLAIRCTVNFDKYGAGTMLSEIKKLEATRIKT